MVDMQRIKQALILTPGLFMVFFWLLATAPEHFLNNVEWPVLLVMAALSAFAVALSVALFLDSRRLKNEKS